MEKKEADFKIYSTKDYGAFKKLLENRDAKGEAKIIASIQDVGYVPAPIICNEKLEVIDGQNRLSALEKLGLPVYYEVIKGVGIDECRALNIGQTNWGTSDFVYSFARGGNQSYQRFASLLNDFRKPFSLQGVYAMSKPSDITDGGVSPATKLKSGRFELSEKEYEDAIKRLTTAQKFGYVDLCKRRKLNARVFYSCVCYIYLNPAVQAEDVAQRLNEWEANLMSVNLVSEQLRIIDDILNRGRRRNQKIYLQADFLKGEYLGGDE